MSATPTGAPAEVALLLAVKEGRLEGLSLAECGAFKKSLGSDLNAAAPDLVARVDRTARLEDPDRARLLAWLKSRGRALSGKKA